MPKDRIRPDPVSCESCRSKKLRCSRVQPCSNCAARGIPCHFLVPPQQRIEPSLPTPSNTELLKRIEQLESISVRSASIEPRLRDPLEKYRQTLTPSTDADAGGSSDIHQGRLEVSDLLDTIGIRDGSVIACLTSGLSVQIKNLQEILDAQTALPQSTLIPGPDRVQNIILLFPRFPIANLLLESYEANVDQLYRILHIPTVKALLRAFYLKINQKEAVQPWEVALLLSIFSVAVLFYEPVQGSKITTNRQDADNLSRLWGRNAWDILDIRRRNTSGTLEDIQAYLILSICAFHIEGFSARGRSLSSTATAIARELGLHQLDADIESFPEQRLGGRTLIDREVKRRVFWHIVSSEWILSTTSGPQQGTYLIHPNHISVRAPKDGNDEDTLLMEGIELSGESKANSTPTGMTYFLEKVRLAHICREMTDTVPLQMSRLLQIPYDQIIAIDNALEAFILSLPLYFRFDAESRERTKPLEMIYPNIPLSRYYITTTAHIKRCELHRRFLVRKSSDEAYNFSRKACLQSAGAVIEGYEILREYHSSNALTPHLGMCVRYTYFALAILVMDLCCNKDELNEVETKTRVKTAFQMFEDAEDVSPLPGYFLNSLSDVLQMHKVDLAASSKFDNVPGNDSFRGTEQSTCASTDDGMQLSLDTTDSSSSFDASFDNFWQMAMESETNIDTVTWDNLFSDLNSRSL